MDSWSLQQTAETRRELSHDAYLRDCMPKVTISVWSQADDGEWFENVFGNEGAAQEFEAKGRKRGFATKREG